jgi:hypothetical protein
METAEMTSQEALPLYEAIMANKKRTNIGHNEMEIHRYNKWAIIFYKTEMYHFCSQQTDESQLIVT